MLIPQCLKMYLFFQLKRQLSNLKHINGLQAIRNKSNMRTVTLIPGDGIGPEISVAVQKIFQAADVSIVPYKYLFNSLLFCCSIK